MAKTIGSDWFLSLGYQKLVFFYERNSGRVAAGLLVGTTPPYQDRQNPYSQELFGEISSTRFTEKCMVNSESDT